MVILNNKVGEDVIGAPNKQNIFLQLMLLFFALKKAIDRCFLLPVLPSSCKSEKQHGGAIEESQIFQNRSLELMFKCKKSMKIVAKILRVTTFAIAKLEEQ